jgi:hypothetical protein
MTLTTANTASPTLSVGQTVTLTGRLLIGVDDTNMENSPKRDRLIYTLFDGKNTVYLHLPPNIRIPPNTKRVTVTGKWTTLPQPSQTGVVEVESIIIDQ